MAKILLVEDDTNLCQSIDKWLAYEHHTIEIVENGTDALEHLRFYKFDLVILDWGLPSMSGFDVLKEFRGRGGSTPVLMLTGMNDVEDIEAGLDAGADDYLTKPFHLKELSARVKALLRRLPVEQSEQIEVSGLILYGSSYRVTRDGEEIQLSPQEFLVLRFLMKNSQRVVSPEALLSHLHESDSPASSDTIRTRIKLLRKKLDKEGEPSFIRNVHGVGYQFVARS